MTQNHTVGFFQVNSRYHEAVLIAKYDFKEAIRLRLKSGEEILTTPDLFLKDKPLSPSEQAIVDKRLAAQAKRDAFVNHVLTILDDGPLNTTQLADKAGVNWQTIARRLSRWEAFKHVARGDDGKWVVK